MLKKKGFWIILAAMILLGAGAYVLISQNQPVQARTSGPSAQTSMAFIGSLTISASGTGTVVASEMASVGFYQSGVIGELLVSVGDEVQAGDVLARQSSTEDLELAVNNAELQLNLAESTLQDVYDSYGTDLAAAQLAVVTAQIALEDAETARLQLDYGRCDADIVEDYYGKYVRAKERYDKAVANKSAASVIHEAEDVLYAAWANYDYCTAPRSETEIGQADANVAVAQADLTAAQATYEKLKAGVDADEIAQAEADIATARYNLSVAKKALAGATVTAPIAGTIMSISGSVGDTVEGAFITINRMTPTILTISLDETDLNSIGKGYEVEVVFDAYEGRTFIGHVTLVNPGLTSQGNSGVVSAQVVLDEDPSVTMPTIPIGLSASVEVIGSRAENSVLVPVEALVEQEDGSYAVYVLDNGQPVLREVEVGIMDYTYAEILSGLNAGEMVSTANVKAN